MNLRKTETLKRKDLIVMQIKLVKNGITVKTRYAKETFTKMEIFSFILQLLWFYGIIIVGYFYIIYCIGIFKMFLVKQ